MSRTRTPAASARKFVTQMIWYGYSRSLFVHDFVEELLERAGFCADHPLRSTSRRRAGGRTSSTSTTASARASSWRRQIADRVLFYRDFKRFTGGDLKVWDYFNHVRSSARHDGARALHRRLGVGRDQSLERRAGPRPQRGRRRRLRRALPVGHRLARDDPDRAAGRVPAPDHQPDPARLARVPERPPEPRTGSCPTRRSGSASARRSSKAIDAGPAACAGPSSRSPTRSTWTPSPRWPTRPRATSTCWSRPTSGRELGQPVAARLRRRGPDRGARRPARSRAGMLVRLMGRARVSVLVPNPKEGFYLPALEGWRSGTVVVCPDCIGQPLVLPARRELLPARVRRGRDRGRGRGGAAGGARAGRDARAGAPRPRGSRPRRRARRVPGILDGCRGAAGRQHRSMDTLVVSGAIANKPLNGGEAWVRLSWVLGLRAPRVPTCGSWSRSTRPPASTPTAAPAPFEESENRRYFDQVVERFGLDGRASLLSRGRRARSAGRAAGGAARRSRRRPTCS